ncbi:MAG: hypothetical protein K2K48_05940 [Anaeroplasmataceae bacterium]|nr:hypothetical protein [Anaeroplasmataceae bacterium]MDE6414937.1 hypothetical protein [Anaeroplasmataceae bacterium]
MLRWKWLWKKIVSCADYMEYDEIVELLPFLLKGLKGYTRKHGHFNLVQVEAADGTKVKIKV